MPDLDAVYTSLRRMMLDHSGGLHVGTDDPGRLDLESAEADNRGRRTWRGGVHTKKRYVSYHLMPVYEDPSLLAAISPELKARMQGKSCFNFTSTDDALFAELGSLTEAAFAASDDD